MNLGPAIQTNKERIQTNMKLQMIMRTGKVHYRQNSQSTSKSLFVILIVMLFIFTSFHVLHTAKSWSKYFFCLFSTLFVDFRHFPVICHPKQEKTFFRLLFIIGWHLNAGWLPEGVPVSIHLCNSCSMSYFKGINQE